MQLLFNLEEILQNRREAFWLLQRSLIRCKCMLINFFQTLRQKRFQRDDQDRHVSVNEIRYRSRITEYFWPQLDDMDLEDMWLQQNGTTSHTANVRINLFETNKWSSRLAASVVPFDAVRLFSVGLLQVYGLCLSRWKKNRNSSFHK